MIRLVLCSLQIFTGALLFAIPSMTRRELLFAVPVPAGFRESPAGRHAIAMFRLVVVAVVFAGVCALLLAPVEFMGAVVPAVVISPILAGGFAFYWQNRKIAPLAVSVAPVRAAELTTAPDRLPRFVLLAAGPFVLIVAAAAYLNLNWDRIPARFPVHFGAGGEPNRWAERTAKGVYGLLILAAELCAWLLIMALAGWYGARRSHFRSVMLGIMIAAEYFLGCLFALIALQPLLGIPIWIIALAPLAILVPTLIVVTSKMSRPSDPMDPTPQECWKAGIFYYNPDDPVLFVEKREGFGYTFNFANPWSWILLAGLALVLASGPFILA